jgi:hypothetical protein
MTPLELLQKELNKYERALEKSKESHEKGKIDVGLHLSHARNLEPKIKEFRLAIRVLTTYL